MVSPGRVTKANLDYYKNEVASGAEDYYSGRGRASGSWLGAGADQFGLERGRIHTEKFNAVLAGKDPKTGEYLAAHFERKTVLAVDMTFSAPKSVSVLWALAPQKIRSEIERAHETAVEESFAYLEANYATGRKGRGGIHKVPGKGLTAAAYRHQTSREMDPQLHTHVLVANFVEFEDGTYGSLDTARFWHAAPSMTSLYQHVLRRELTDRLGVDWDRPKHGMADIKGFPEDLKDLFSKRHQQILSGLSKFGHDTPWTRQIQSLLSRKPKQHDPAQEHFDRWSDEAAEHGFSRRDVLRLCNKTKLTRVTHKQIAKTIDKIKHDEILTASRAHFARRDVINVFAAQFPANTSIDQIEQAADEFIASELVQLTPSGDAATHQFTKHQAAGETPLTTPEMFALEQNAIALVKNGLGASTIKLSDDQIQAGLARHAPPTLGEDQRAMIEHILSTGNMVDCVVGDAGTGKTFSFDVATKILGDYGYRVGGGALAAAAAKQLHEKGSMDASTIASLLWRIENPSDKFLRNLPDVLVIDEAVMVGTKDAAAIIDFAHQQNIKLIFVGDAKQLPAIEAGGLFSMIDRHIGSARLYENYRQRANAAHVELVDAWKAGDARTALTLSHQLGQLHVTQNAADMVESMVADWTADPDRNHATMIAIRHTEVRALNNAAQQARLADNELGTTKLQTPIYSFRLGDRVLCKQREENVPHIHNGVEGRVVAIKSRRRSLVIETSNGHRVELPRDYVANVEKLQLAYARTNASVQGSDFRNTYTSVPPGMDIENAYVANSRHTNECHVYTYYPDPTENPAGFDPSNNPEPFDELVRSLKRSSAQTAASELGHVDDYADYSTADLQAAIHEQQETMTLDIVAQYDEIFADTPTDQLPEDLYIDPSIIRTWAEQHPAAAQTYQSLRLEITRRIRNEAALASVKPPKWALAEIGPVPTDPILRTYWRTAYKHLVIHRLEFSITDRKFAYGPATQSLPQRKHARVTSARVDQARQHIESAATQITGSAL